MAKEARKHEKAVVKISKVIRKAVDKGVSADLVTATVARALGEVVDVDTGGSDDATPIAATARKLPGLRKYASIHGKRGYTADAKAPDVNTEPMQADGEKRSLKKLPGKRKPPTLTLKSGKMDAAASTSKKAAKVTGLKKQTDVTMKRG